MKSQIVAPFFQPFSLLLYDFKTELKIKWLVNLLGFFFQCTLFLLWMNSSFSISPPSWLHSIHHFCPHIFDTFTKAKKIKKFKKKNSRWIYCRYFSKYELFFRRVWLLRWWTVKRERGRKKKMNSLYNSYEKFSPGRSYSYSGHFWTAVGTVPVQGRVGEGGRTPYFF